jgi:hypothetical protein
MESLPIDFEVLGENTLRNFDYPDTQSVYRIQLTPGESVPPPDESIQREAPASTQKLMFAVIVATLLVIAGAAYWFNI